MIMVPVREPAMIMKATPGDPKTRRPGDPETRRAHPASSAVGTDQVPDAERHRDRQPAKQELTQP
jgi:hypothetical protein